jgi:hypothetical protein
MGTKDAGVSLPRGWLEMCLAIQPSLCPLPDGQASSSRIDVGTDQLRRLNRGEVTLSVDFAIERLSPDPPAAI